MTEYDATEIAYKNGYKDGLADGRPKKSKWIFHNNDLLAFYKECSLCGHMTNEYVLERTNGVGQAKAPYFCPNCGADMRGNII